MTRIIDVDIVHSTLIRAPIEKVFDAISTGEGLDSWFTQGAKVERKLGGSIYFRWEGERTDITEGTIEDGGPVLEVERPTCFVFQWSPDNNSYLTTVELNFKEEEKGTRVSIKEKGFHDTPEGRKAMIGCSTGWGEALTMMKYYLEHGVKY
ncbi:MAG: SRPBCC domain-containing protein [Candidatus Heimdallarchaeota archaeon]|nr:SRPBCC domain-containing protein [Candidatus Heimdallarchaeota archaeon]MCK4769637.1 SRPBCC domain-containing protein [Candidatus Heimdallarchaeota archaeon]